MATQAQIDAATALQDLRQLIRDYEDVPDATDENGQAVFERARSAIDKLAALAAAAEVDPDGSKFITARNAAMWDAATIERCAQVADEYGGWGPHIAAAIRALATEREYDPNVEPCNDAEFGCKP